MFKGSLFLLERWLNIVFFYTVIMLTLQYCNFKDFMNVITFSVLNIDVEQLKLITFFFR